MSYYNIPENRIKITKEEAEQIYNKGGIVYIIIECDEKEDTIPCYWRAENPQTFRQTLEDIEYFLADRILGYEKESEV